MVLGSHVALDPLSVVSTPLVNVCSGIVTTDKGDCPDFWRIQDTVDRIMSTVNDVEHPVWDTSFLGQLGKDHGCTGSPFRWLENKSVTSSERGGDRPEWDWSQRLFWIRSRRLAHGGKVEGANGGGDTKGISNTVRVHILCNLDVLSLEQSGDGRERVHDLQTSEHISHGIGVRLALFYRDSRRDFRLVLADQGLVPVVSRARPPSHHLLEENVLAREQRGLFPSLESVVGDLEGFPQFRWGGLRGPRHNLLRGL